MNSGAIGVVVVFDVNDELVAPAGLDQRSREGLVEDFASSLFKAICSELKVSGEKIRLVL